jgi:hypothetical protein
MWHCVCKAAANQAVQSFATENSADAPPGASSEEAGAVVLPDLNAALERLILAFYEFEMGVCLLVAYHDKVEILGLLQRFFSKANPSDIPDMLEIISQCFLSEEHKMDPKTFPIVSIRLREDIQVSIFKPRAIIKLQHLHLSLCHLPLAG